MMRKPGLTLILTQLVTTLVILIESCKIDDVYIRAGEIPSNCPSSHPDKEGLGDLVLCYENCKSGYYDATALCISKNLIDWCSCGFLCPGYPCTDSYIRSTTTPSCGSGEKNVAGLCYSACPNDLSEALIPPSQTCFCDVASIIMDILDKVDDSRSGLTTCSPLLLNKIISYGSISDNKIAEFIEYIYNSVNQFSDCMDGYLSRRRLLYDDNYVVTLEMGLEINAGAVEVGGALGVVLRSPNSNDVGRWYITGYVGITVDLSVAAYISFQFYTSIGAVDGNSYYGSLSANADPKWIGIISPISPGIDIQASWTRDEFESAGIAIGVSANAIPQPPVTGSIGTSTCRWLSDAETGSTVDVSECNWYCYLNRYGDLQKAFGSNLGKAKNHYYSHGKKEGRNCFCDPLNNIAGGDGFIQIGKFRIGKVNDKHFSVSSITGKKTNIIFRDDGTVHPGPRNDYGLWNKALSTPTNVKIGKYGIVFGDNEWCLGLSNKNSKGQYHLSLSCRNNQGITKTARIWRDDGNVYNGPRSDFLCWSPDTANSVISDKSASGDYIQFGDMFRIGDTGTNKNGQYHLSVVSKKTAQIYRDDGQLFPGPRTNWAPDNKYAPF